MRALAITFYVIVFYAIGVTLVLNVGAPAHSWTVAIGLVIINLLTVGLGALLLKITRMPR